MPGARTVAGLARTDPQALDMMTKSWPERRSGCRGLSVTIITIPGCVLFVMARWNESSALSLDTTDSSDASPPESFEPTFS